MKLINLVNKQVLAHEVKFANTFWTRFKGLMFTKDLPLGCALAIQPCQSIHTFFMNYEIDVLYVNENLEIVAKEESIKPSKVGKVVKQAKSVIELPAGHLKATNTEIGHIVQYKK